MDHNLIATDKKNHKLNFNGKVLTNWKAISLNILIKQIGICENSIIGNYNEATSFDRYGRSHWCTNNVGCSLPPLIRDSFDPVNVDFTIWRNRYKYYLSLYINTLSNFLRPFFAQIGQTEKC